MSIFSTRLSFVDSRTLGVGFVFLTLLWVSFLLNGLLHDAWLFNAEGRIIANDFVNVWAAGHLAQLGQAASAYDWVIHRQAEISVLGYDFQSYFGWHYPPMFLFVAYGLAAIPYVYAWGVWIVLTLALYCEVVRRIVGHWSGVFLVTAFPATIWNVSVGQNGFFTAALMGAALLLLDARPKGAGVWLGVLAYKPQFGVLFPFMLLMEKRWQVVVIASSVLLLLAGLSVYAFGVESWQAFFHWMPVVSDAVLTKGQAHFSKLQSIFGVVRWLGGSVALATALQGALTLAVFVVTLAVRRFVCSWEVKQAMLAVATILVTPYVYIYDIAILVVPLAFLLRLALREGMLAGDMLVVAAIFGCVLVSPIIGVPTGFAAMLLTAGVIVRRAVYEQSLQTRGG